MPAELPSTMAAFRLEDFDPAQPQRFYLGQRQATLEALADATLVVEGARLPVHTQVLSLHSSVLGELFAAVAPAASRKRKAQELEGTQVIASNWEHAACTGCWVLLVVARMLV